MRKKLLSTALFLSVIFPALSYAFNFDVWDSGMTVEDAIQVAERNDIPIQRSGIISGDKKFNPSVRKYATSATQFYYRSELLGKPATVNLLFTPESRGSFALSP